MKRHLVFCGLAFAAIFPVSASAGTVIFDVSTGSWTLGTGWKTSGTSDNQTIDATFSTQPNPDGIGSAPLSPGQSYQFLFGSITFREPNTPGLQGINGAEANLTNLSIIANLTLLLPSNITGGQTVFD